MAESTLSVSGPLRPRTFGALVRESDLKEELFGPQAEEFERTFKALFCARFDCRSADYTQQAFRKCLYWQARLLAPLILTFQPGFFAEDVGFIRSVGKTTNAREVNVEIQRWRGGAWVLADFLRTSCHLRVSGRKVLRLARALFNGARSEPKHIRLVHG